MYFFDDLEQNPAELLRSILLFLGADPNKPSGRSKAEQNSDGGRDKIPLIAKVRSRMAEFFEQELKARAAQLGGLSLLCVIWQLSDYLDLFV